MVMIGSVLIFLLVYVELAYSILLSIREGHRITTSMTDKAASIRPLSVLGFSQLFCSC